MSRKKAPPQQPSWLLSIDPAAEAGWAIFYLGQLRACGACDGTKWKTLVAHIDEEARYALGQMQRGTESRECTIEDGFFQYGKQTFKGTLTLGRRRGLAQAAGEALGFDKFTFIGPSTWQNGLGWQRGQDTKVWSLARAKRLYPGPLTDDITHDVADAINIGSYYLDSFLVSA